MKSSANGDELHAALIGNVLVIGDKEALLSNHKGIGWLLHTPRATPEVKGKLKVKKGKGLSAGSLTATGDLAVQKAKIAPRIAEFSKKKLLEG